MISTRSVLPRVILPLLVSWCLTGAVLAEVGALIPSGSSGDGAFPFVLGVITEDNEPIGGVWKRYNVDSATRVVLNPEGETNMDGAPAILFNPVSNKPVVAWARNSASGYDIVYSTLDNGAWITPVVVAGDPAVDELDPHLSLDPATGEMHLFYWVDDATPRVMYRSAPAALDDWSAPVQVSDPADPACRPAGAMHDGVLHVAFEVHHFGAGQTPRQVVVSRLENDTFVPEIVSVTSHSGKVQPQVHSRAGRIWVDWIDSPDEAAWTRLDGQGNWEPLRYEPFSSVEQRDYAVRRAIRLKAID